MAVSVAAGLVSIAALGIAIITMQRSDRNTSAATVLGMNEAFSQGWRRFLDPECKDKEFEFAELINVFEIACAIHQDDSVHGASKEILEEYLCHTLAILEGSEDARAQIAKLRNAPTTFKYVIKFLIAMRLSGKSQPIERLIEPAKSPIAPD